MVQFSKIIIFAADSQLYHHFFPTNIHLALTRVTQDAQAVANWARTNGLILNSSKTKIVILGSVLYTHKLDLEILPRVVIDGYLRHLDDERVKKLETTMNGCFRFVVGNIPRLGQVTPHRLALGWLSATRRREYAICLQAFKVVANGHPQYLSDRFNGRVSVDLDLCRSERHPHQPFELPPRRTEAYKHSFALEEMDLLNSTHWSDFSPSRIASFKRTLRDTLFRCDIAGWNLRVLWGLPNLLALPSATTLSCSATIAVWPNYCVRWFHTRHSPPFHIDSPSPANSPFTCFLALISSSHLLFHLALSPEIKPINTQQPTASSVITLHFHPHLYFIFALLYYLLFYFISASHHYYLVIFIYKLYHC